MINQNMPSLAGEVTAKSKLGNMLELFCQGRYLNRYEAETFHDHCLHTTVSTLKNTHGIEFLSYWETVPCLGGRAWVRVKRYSLKPTPANIKAARTLLGLWDAMEKRRIEKKAQANKDKEADQ